MEQLLPAFASCKKAKVAALVSGTPEKAKLIAAEYGIPSNKVFSYEQFEQLQHQPDVQAVYIVLPNGVYREYVERAAKVQKHVLCEKPMTVSSKDAEAMVAACRQAGVKLMVAYRCQYEVNNRLVIHSVRSNEFGPVRAIHAINVQNMAAPNQWRFQKALSGGGSLPDVGLYCLNTSRALLGEEPVEIAAQIHSPPNDPRFTQVEDTVSFALRFPSGAIANCTSGYSAHEQRSFFVLGPQQWARLDNAFAYRDQNLYMSKREGMAESTRNIKPNYKNQFSLEIDHMAECIKNGREPRTPGEEGLQDHRMMEAIYEAAAGNRAVKLPVVSGLDTTRGPALSPVEG